VPPFPVGQSRSLPTSNSRRDQEWQARPPLDPQTPLASASAIPLGQPPLEAQHLLNLASAVSITRPGERAVPDLHTPEFPPSDKFRSLLSITRLSIPQFLEQPDALLHRPSIDFSQNALKIHGHLLQITKNNRPTLSANKNHIPRPSPG